MVAKTAKLALAVLMILLAALFVAELVARVAMGLGTPPLSISHPEIEYMFAPNQDVQRFGNRQMFNEYGMRSIELDKVHQDERVLVFGDSVLNGGNLTDHEELATTLATNNDVFFGNVSAGSWGPQNIIAWIQQFGLLDADRAIFVLSAHDLVDFPSYEPLKPDTHPTERPMLAIIEGLKRYLPRYLPLNSSRESASSPEAQLSHDEVQQGRKDVAELIEIVRKAHVAPCFVFHHTQKELLGEPNIRMSHLREVINAREVPVVDFGTFLQPSLAEGNSPFRDDIHINALGQKLLAEALAECSKKARNAHNDDV